MSVLVQFAGIQRFHLFLAVIGLAMIGCDIDMPSFGPGSLSDAENAIVGSWTGMEDGKAVVLTFEAYRYFLKDGKETGYWSTVKGRITMGQFSVGYALSGDGQQLTILADATFPGPRPLLPGTYRRIAVGTT